MFCTSTLGMSAVCVQCQYGCLCTSLISCFTGMLLRYCLSDFGVVPVDPIITLLLIFLNPYKLGPHVVDGQVTSYGLDGPSIEFS